ncbi:S-layer homology domain-containing protein [Paenibacillus sp. FA6]|uniref:S-layer homology domain-containing protein n=1 Tax=Paenibacillus sp. FA6 TaxID=3413029 RepID=UPI003F65DE07
MSVANAVYQVNGSSWQPVVYDGSTPVQLMTESAPGKYTVKAKLSFTSGETVEDELTFEIAKAKDPETVVPDPLVLSVQGKQNTDGTYEGAVDVSLPIYASTGLTFVIAKAKVPDGGQNPGIIDKDKDKYKYEDNKVEIPPSVYNVPRGVIRLIDRHDNLRFDQHISQLELSDQTITVKAGDEDEVYLLVSVQTLKDLFANNEEAELLITFGSGTYTLPFDLVNQMKETIPNDGILTLTINKLSDVAKAEVEQSFKEKYPSGMLVSDFYDIKLGIANRDNTTVQALATNTFANLTLHTLDEGNAVLRYANAGFSFVPAKLTEREAAVLMRGDGIVVVARNDVQFSDIIGHWGMRYMIESANKGLIVGRREGIFAPNELITRAEFVQMIVNSLNLPVYNEVVDHTNLNNSYDDIASSKWYFEAIHQAKQAGILTKFSELGFYPDKPITREEMASIIAVVLRNHEIDVKATERNLTEIYKDAGQMSESYFEDIAMIVDANIMEGKTKDTFNPEGAATRAESTKVILLMLRAMDFIE